MKKAAFVLPGMKGGGAERVAALLANEFYKNDIDIRYLLTHAKKEEVVRCDLADEIPLELFTERMGKKKTSDKAIEAVLGVVSSLLCKPFELLNKPVPAGFAKLSVTAQYRREIKQLRDVLSADPELTVIAFLQPTIPITLLAARGLPNRVIISERADPNRLMKSRYGKKFIEKYYTRADAAVFQTQDAKSVYPKSVADKGTVIPNPLKPGLPEAYHGKRNKTVTTFCRISKQKNLPLLTEAFFRFSRDYPEYRLRIIGDALNKEGTEVRAELDKLIADCNIEDKVIFEPFSADVHSMILKDAMYVNSSDYEGICNAMLEAMAVGMPVICTDCPIGGAKATIQNGENGLLTPVCDAEALYNAMRLIAQDEELSVKLSKNAASLRRELAVDNIADKWIRLLG